MFSSPLPTKHVFAMEGCVGLNKLGVFGGGGGRKRIGEKRRRELKYKKRREIIYVVTTLLVSFKPRGTLFGSI